MGIMTTEQWENKQNNISNSVEVEPQIKERKLMKKVNVLQLESAPMGECNVAAYVGVDEDKNPITKQFKLVDKQLYIDKLDLGENEKLELMRILMKDNNFKEVSFYEDSGEIVKEIIVKKTSWKLGHPDNQPNEKIQGKYGIMITNTEGESEEVTLDIIDGVVHTEREDIANALRKLHFYDVSDGPTFVDSTKEDEVVTETIIVVDEELTKAEKEISEAFGKKAEETTDSHDVSLGEVFEAQDTGNESLGEIPL